MFERFTDRARKVIVIAQEEARMLEHDYIGTEHILLGLVREEEGVGARALADLGISLEGVRREVEGVVGRGGAAAAGHIPFTPRAKKVLELALREAMQLDHDYIGTEHLLLGLIRERDGVAAQVLRSLGADLDRVRQTVLQLVSGPAAASAPPITRSWRGRRGRRFPWPEVERTGPVTPSCPSCGGSLESVATHRRMRVKDEAGEEELDIRVLYCRRCGRTLGTSIP